MFSARQLNAMASGNTLQDHFRRLYLQSISQSSALFGGMDQVDLGLVLDQCHLLTLRPGECVYRVGDFPRAIYLLLAGGIDLRLESTRSPLVKESLQTGASFGDAALLGILPHSALPCVPGPRKCWCCRLRGLRVCSNSHRNYLLTCY